NVLSCSYYPDGDIEVILPEKRVAEILVSQTEFLEDCVFSSPDGFLCARPYGVAVDIGTTTVAMYFLNLLTGSLEKITSFLNPQGIHGADVISRITYCQEHEGGSGELQRIIINSINNELDLFRRQKGLQYGSIERVIVSGNTTMLHLLLGEDPVPIALAPFRPKFTGKQRIGGSSSGLHINPDGELITLPCVSAYVGADVVSGLAVIKPVHRNYLFIDIGTNGEMALVEGDRILTCATAAGPAFEGGSISCGMAAVNGAVSDFAGPEDYRVIGNMEPAGICGSGIVDIVAYLLNNNIIDKTGLLKFPFVVYPANKTEVTQQDIREIQLAKSAIYSGIKVLLNNSGMKFDDINALYLAGGFGNYINTRSAIRTGLLPAELGDRIYAVGNSAGIGTLQYLKSEEFAERLERIASVTGYIELSDSDDFITEFVMNMDFRETG
ncbi:MAG: ATP-binding protein, partial [Bacteroidales bacterium]|nr:ATP-binding protein [Bacteroidales bacterium]